MSQDLNWNKISTHFIHIKDGLGVCRRCTFFDNMKYPIQINIGDDDYFNAICIRKNTYCYLIRNSILRCIYFKLPNKPKKENLLFRIIRCFKTNDWSHL